MKLTRLIVVVFLVVLFCHAQSETVVLTENTGVGKTFSKTADVTIDWAQPDTSSHHNHGGALNLFFYRSGGDGDIRFDLIRFDLSVLPTVKSVESAVLRLYQYQSNAAHAKEARAVLADWVEGSGNGTYSSILNGCTAYAHAAPRLMQKGNLVAGTHLGKNVWYINGVTNLSIYAYNGNDYFIGRFLTTDATIMRNDQFRVNRLTKANNLDDLVNNYAQGATAYCYVPEEERIYLRFNNYGIAWYQDEDLWTGVPWTGSRKLGPTDVDIGTILCPDITVTRLQVGWYEIDVTAVAKQWLENDLPNYGLKVRPSKVGYNGNFRSSEGTDGERPELVLTYTPKGPLGTFIMVK